MMQLSPIDAIIGVVGFAWLLYQVRRPVAKGLRPPGPARLPVLGNVLQASFRYLPFWFRELAEEYGGLALVQVAPLRMLVIGDRSLAHELLSVRSARYSSRMDLPYLNRIDPHGHLWAGGSDPKRVKVGRQLSQQALQPVQRGAADGVFERNATHFCRQVMSDPSAWMEHIARASMRTLVTLTYGDAATGRAEAFLEEFIDSFNAAFGFGGFILSYLPFLDSVPGIGRWKRRTHRLGSLLESYNHNDMADGLAEKVPNQSWYKVFARTPYGYRSLLGPMIGAVGTSPTVLLNFVLATLVSGQEFYTVAQKQIDAFVGTDRMPCLTDRPHLPLVEAILREVLRFYPPSAIGIPHVSSEDDLIEYRGRTYLIPAGTAVFAAPSAIEHNKAEFGDPENYRPGRWLDDEGQLLPGYKTSVFGYGSRACPGKRMGEKISWINIATVIWLFNLRQTPGFVYRGDKTAFTQMADLTCRPLDFPALFEPRDNHRVAVMEQTYAEYSKDPV